MAISHNENGKYQKGDIRPTYQHTEQCAAKQYHFLRVALRCCRDYISFAVCADL